MAATLRAYAHESEIHLHNGDAAYFDQLLPRSESWRMYGDFRDNAAYVDIETTGSRGIGDITVIGLFDGIRTRVFVKGKNLDDFKNEIRKYALMVTYNGKYFDVPFMCDTFGNIFTRIAHIDLQYFLQRLGYVGGLKEIQEQFGFHRDGLISRLDGRYAIWLWEEYEKGNKKALNTLLRYNLEDTVVLQALAEAVYNESVRLLPIQVTELISGRMPRIDIPYDEELVRKLGKRRTLRSHTHIPPIRQPDEPILQLGNTPPP
jgi:uncharacterized protein YprB with RNaseH-like and TPR domain